MPSSNSEQALKTTIDKTRIDYYLGQIVDKKRFLRQWTELGAIAKVINVTVNRSIQVSVFKDRVEIFNPGGLPDERAVADLGKPHGLFPRNPLLANCMFLTGDIERYGTGTLEILDSAKKVMLPTPSFRVDGGFKVVLWRPGARKRNDQDTDNVTDQVTDQVRDQVNDLPELVFRLIRILTEPMGRSEMIKLLDLRHLPSFRENYLNPAIKGGYIEMTDPGSPKSPRQKYRLTEKGKTARKKKMK